MVTYESLKACTLCIRNCSVDRLNGEVGFCNASKNIKASKATLHFWEEPCLSLKNGSGTVFFSNCNLRCVFCQNHTISQEGNGIEISIQRLSQIFLELQGKGANNINLVTPTHYVPQIIEALKIAKDSGLIIPVVYNTNGYDNLETIKALDGFIDIYLPDYKYFNDKYSLEYSKANNYSQNIKKIIKEMVRQVGNPVFYDNGLMKKGVIVRHLMLPSLLFDSKKVIEDIFYTFGNSVYISIMNQYTPMHKSNLYPKINKPLNPKHYDALVDHALLIGVTQGFIQDSGTNTSSYVPIFDNEGL